MAKPLIRPAVPAEAGLVADLVLRANAENVALFPSPVADAYTAEIRRIAGRVGEVLVAEVGNGRMVGTATFVVDAADDSHAWPGGGGVLRFLAVAPEARGSGLGEALTAACVARARAAGLAFLGLHTAPVMTAAQRLYERLGFERAPDHDFDPLAHYGGDGGGGPDEPPWGLAYVLRFRPADED